MDSVGTGLAALAFWGFIASMVVAGIWDGARKREAEHETLRRMIDGGKPLDEALLTRLMVGAPKRPHRDLAIGAIIVFSVAVGLPFPSPAMFSSARPMQGAHIAQLCLALDAG